MQTEILNMCILDLNELSPKEENDSLNRIDPAEVKIFHNKIQYRYHSTKTITAANGREIAAIR
jgi:hypothetical protein